jgi:pyruvate,water dikinase
MAEALTLDLFAASPGAAALIGNKAASLVELHRAGFRVPRGVCLTTAAHREWRRAGVTGEALRARISEAFLRLKSPVAVRSSSPAEDREDASFAGQYVTVLGVRTREELLAAVEQCWRSASSAASVAYRRDQGAEADVEMAVLIQELVPATSAGVLFTMNPVTGRADQIVINSNFGLGESVVAGVAEPDTLVVDKARRRAVETRIGTKKVWTHPQAAGASRTPLEPERQRTLSLDEAQVAQLVEAAQRLEAHYDGPMDAEWAFVDQTLHMLQARPVTTGYAAYLTHSLDRWARDRNLEDDPAAIWVRGSVLSGLPVSPLYYSEMSAFFADMFPQIARLHRAPPIRDKIFRYHDGFTYTNASFSSKADPPGTSVQPESPFGAAWRSNLRIALRHPFSLAFWCNIDYYDRKWRNEWKPGLDAHRPDLAAASLLQIRDYIEYIETQRRVRSTVAGLAVGYAPNFLGLLVYLLRRWIPDAPEDSLGVLTSGVPDSLTHEENVDLWLLSQSAARRPAVRAAIVAGRFDSIQGQPEGKAFLDEVDAFRKRHAHRGSSDRDIYQPRWGDDRESLLKQVAVMLGLGANADPGAAHERAAGRRKVREREMLSRVGRGPLGFLRRMVFERVLRTTQRYTIHRDNQRHTFEPYFLELRRAYSAIGAKFTAQGAIEERTDIFFLGKNEIYDHLDGRLTDAQIRRRAGWRRRWWQRTTQQEPPAFLQGNQAYEPEASAGASADLTGSGGAPGVVSGQVRLIASLQQLHLIRPG